jgi:two-component system response regulator ResD
MTDAERRILVVDDDDAIRALLLTIVRRRGLKADAARNGAEALDRCMRCNYSLVLLDLMMPRMSGYDFLAEIRKLPHDQRPIVIVLTAGTPPRHLDPEVVAGSVRKPFDIELLVDTVVACIATREARSQLDNCPAADSENSGARPDKAN